MRSSAVGGDEHSPPQHRYIAALADAARQFLVEPLDTAETFFEPPVGLYGQVQVDRAKRSGYSQGRPFMLG